MTHKIVQKRPNGFEACINKSDGFVACINRSDGFVACISAGKSLRNQLFIFST